ncbi:fumarate reductase/succinate dehydrogenase flavoprotein domain-containing protein [Amycolatopsis methanolica 239]|uniref:Fumarate reductase/succinate dehydrogenase flavoprotein domain-containing protein n=1 Tax=Amycolatopsis methanolica 239 TaxID=1068978 RepID=A0A076MLU6_AMYME|nr:FAD-binding protein [Amycolatopsis methanolica]AIJ21704.1 fumarate reductase/succinate dehydrogenase flavoprotein domain-containing protein [Amycolatopsis methanolica 239]
MAERDALAGGAADPGLLAQRAADGVRTMGGALVGRLLVAALEREVDIVAGTPVTGLEPGWTVRAGREIRASAVVLASGGFEWNPTLREAFLPFPVTPISARSNTGDSLVLGLRAGAAVGDMTAVWGVPVLTPPTARYDGQQSGRMGNVEMTLPGSLTVTAAGRRFVNEATNYHDLNRAFGPIGSRAFLVFDRAYLDRYPVAGCSGPQPWMVQADTVAGLAAAAGIDPALVETVEALRSTRPRVVARTRSSAAVRARGTATSATRRSPRTRASLRSRPRRSSRCRCTPECSGPRVAWRPTGTARWSTTTARRSRGCTRWATARRPCSTTPTRAAARRWARRSCGPTGSDSIWDRWPGPRNGR